jgi:hypothetical protein
MNVKNVCSVEHEITAGKDCGKLTADLTVRFRVHPYDPSPELLRVTIWVGMGGARRQELQELQELQEFGSCRMMNGKNVCAQFEQRNYRRQGTAGRFELVALEPCVRPGLL